MPETDRYICRPIIDQKASPHLSSKEHIGILVVVCFPIQGDLIQYALQKFRCIFLTWRLSLILVRFILVYSTFTISLEVFTDMIG